MTFPVTHLTHSNVEEVIRRKEITDFSFVTGPPKPLASFFLNVVDVTVFGSMMAIFGWNIASIAQKR